MPPLSSLSWPPRGCAGPLPRFHPPSFLESLGGKKIGLVGDSLNEYFLVALLCALRSADPGAAKWKRKRAWHFDILRIIFKELLAILCIMKTTTPDCRNKDQHPNALPPLALMTGLDNFPSELHYPASLMKLWRKCTGATPAHGFSSADTSQVNRHSRVSHSPSETLLHRNNINPEFLPGDFQSEVGSQPEVSSIEKARTQQVNMKFQAIFNDVDMAASDHFTTPWSPGGRNSGSIPSSGSGHKFLPHEQEELPSSARHLELPVQIQHRGHWLLHLGARFWAPSLWLVLLLLAASVHQTTVPHVLQPRCYSSECTKY